MAEIEVNGARFRYELNGQGDGLVLVHGSWDDRHGFDAVTPALAERFRVTATSREPKAVARPSAPRDHPRA